MAGRGFATPSFTGAIMHLACSPAAGRLESEASCRRRSGPVEVPAPRVSRPARGPSRVSASTRGGRHVVASLLCLMVAAYSSELVQLIQPPPAHHECGCAPNCICRGADNQCTCQRGSLNLGAACGCGDQAPTADAPTPPLFGLLSAGPTVPWHEVSLPLASDGPPAPETTPPRKPAHPP